MVEQYWDAGRISDRPEVADQCSRQVTFRTTWIWTQTSPKKKGSKGRLFHRGKNFIA